MHGGGDRTGPEGMRAPGGASRMGSGAHTFPSRFGVEPDGAERDSPASGAHTFPSRFGVEPDSLEANAPALADATGAAQPPGGGEGFELPSLGGAEPFDLRLGLDCGGASSSLKMDPRDADALLSALVSGTPAAWSGQWGPMESARQPEARNAPAGWNAQRGALGSASEPEARVNARGSPMQQEGRTQAPHSFVSDFASLVSSHGGQDPFRILAAGEPESSRGTLVAPPSVAPPVAAPSVQVAIPGDGLQAQGGKSRSYPARFGVSDEIVDMGLRQSPQAWSPELTLQGRGLRAGAGGRVGAGTGAESGAAVEIGAKAGTGARQGGGAGAGVGTGDRIRADGQASAGRKAEAGGGTAAGQASEAYVKGGAERGSAAKRRVDVEAASSLKPETDPQDVGQSFNSSIPREVQGFMSAHWVLLGQDLRNKGITLGLETFLEASSKAELSSPERHDVSAGTSPGPAARAPSVGPAQNLGQRLPDIMGSITDATRQPKVARADQPGSSLGLSVLGASYQSLALPSQHLPGLTSSPGWSAQQPSWSNLSFSVTSGEQRMKLSLPRSLPPFLPTANSQQYTGKDAFVKESVLRAAHALEGGDRKKFAASCIQLRPSANRRGQAVNRVANVLLEAFLQKTQGTGFSFANKPCKHSIAELNNARMWYFSGCPFHPFANIAFTGMMLPVIRGKRNIHIVTVGEGILPSIPSLIKLLSHPQKLLAAPPGASRAAQSGGVGGGSAGKSRRGGGVVGPPSGPLKRMRITSISTWHLARPGRLDFEAMKEAGQVANVLGRVAASAGVKFEFNGLRLIEGGGTQANLELLRKSVQHRSDEVLAFCGSIDVKFLPDELGPTQGEPKLLVEFLKAIKPDSIGIVEENMVNGSNYDFMARVDGMFDYMLQVYEAHDALGGNKKAIQLMEQQWFALNVMSVVAVKEHERRLYPKASVDWGNAFRREGFAPVHVGKKVVDAAHELLTSYPGFGIMQDRNGLHLTWHGRFRAFASFWKLDK